MIGVVVVLTVHTPNNFDKRRVHEIIRTTANPAPHANSILRVWIHYSLIDTNKTHTRRTLNVTKLPLDAALR